MEKEKIEDRLNQLVGIYSQVEDQVNQKVIEEKLDKIKEELLNQFNAEFQTLKHEIIHNFRMNNALNQILGEVDEAKRMIRMLLISAKEDQQLTKHFLKKLENHCNDIRGYDAGIIARLLNYTPIKFHPSSSLFPNNPPVSQTWKDEIKRHLQVIVRIKAQNISITQNSLFFSQSSPFFIQPQNHPQFAPGSSLFLGQPDQVKDPRRQTTQSAAGSHTRNAPQGNSSASTQAPSQASTLFGSSSQEGISQAPQIANPFVSSGGPVGQNANPSFGNFPAQNIFSSSGGHSIFQNPGSNTEQSQNKPGSSFFTKN